MAYTKLSREYGMYKAVAPRGEKRECPSTRMMHESQSACAIFVWSLNPSCAALISENILMQWFLLSQISYKTVDLLFTITSSKHSKQ